MAKRGRPKGTTRDAGYKVSPGRPKKKRNIFIRIIKNLTKIINK